tara:strand:- start:1980 stop:2819 length:840 start_codon:yes stop_codon:yes gene_type:complete
MDRNLIDIYKNNGFIEFEDLFSDEQINRWNDVLDRFYLEKDKKVTLDLLELGKPGFEIVKEFLNDKVKFIIDQLIKDPIIFYAGSNEIPSKQKISHVNHNELEGWHTDTGENLQYLNLNYPFWITFFVYLTDVGQNDGAFEISNVTKKKNIKHKMKCFKLMGKRGKAFVWGNPFFHRASPNNGNTRRRILKIQIQHNYLENTYIKTLNKVHDYIDDHDHYINYIFGKKHFSSYRDWGIGCDIKKQDIKILNYNYDQDYNSNIKLEKINNIKKKIKDLFV